MTIGAVNKDRKRKENFAGNRAHNILKLFDVLPNFLLTTSETKQDYFYETWYTRLLQELLNYLKLKT